MTGVRGTAGGDAAVQRQGREWMSKGRDRALFVSAHAAKPAPDVQTLATINMHIIVLCLE